MDIHGTPSGHSKVPRPIMGFCCGSLGVPWAFIIEFYEAHWTRGGHSCRFYCIKIPLQESEASSACLCVLPGSMEDLCMDQCILRCTNVHCTRYHAPWCILVLRSALHVVRCIPKKCIPHWWAAAKGRPPAFDLTRPLFQTVLSSLARVESVSAAM